MFFSRYARRVTMLVRGESLASSMSQYLIDRIADTKNVEVLTRSVITSVRGTGKLEAVTISDLADGHVA